MKKVYFYFLDKINSFGAVVKKRDLENTGIEIDIEKQEHHIYFNSNLKITKSLFIILVFSLMGVFAKNSNEPINVFGFDIIVWKFCIIFSLLFASNSVYQYLTHDLPKIIINNHGIKIKNIGFFEWKNISKFMIETRQSLDSYGVGFNLAIKYNNIWYRTEIDEMDLKKEEIEAITYYYWRKYKKIPTTIYSPKTGS